MNTQPPRTPYEMHSSTLKTTLNTVATLDLLFFPRSWSLVLTRTRWRCSWTSPLRRLCWGGIWLLTSTRWWALRLSRRNKSTWNHQVTRRWTPPLKSGWESADLSSVYISSVQLNEAESPDTRKHMLQLPDSCLISADAAHVFWHFHFA